MNHFYEKLWDSPNVDHLNINWAQVSKSVNYLSKRVEFTSGKKVLDVACGVGAELIELALRGADAIGIDLSQPMLDIARKLTDEKSAQVSFVCKDMRSIDWACDFDVTMIRDVIFGIFDRATNIDIFRKLIKSTKPTGRIFLEVYNKTYALEKGVEKKLFYNKISERFEGSFFMVENGRKLEVEASMDLMTVEEWFKILSDFGLDKIEITDSNNDKVCNESRILHISATCPCLLKHP